MSITLININAIKNHRKFWNAETILDGTLVSVKWGRIGTRGQSQIKEFRSNRDAVRFIQKKASSKLDRGYEMLSKGAL